MEKVNSHFVMKVPTRRDLPKIDDASNLVIDCVAANRHSRGVRVFDVPRQVVIDIARRSHLLRRSASNYPHDAYSNVAIS